MFQIRIGFNADPNMNPDQAFYLNADPDPDPGSQTNADPDPRSLPSQEVWFLHENILNEGTVTCHKTDLHR